MDQWGKLWECAIGTGTGPAKIVIDPEECGLVTLEWPDGSVSSLYWDNGDWQFAEALNTCPGDVAARDSF
jgi:hypothetical protein